MFFHFKYILFWLLPLLYIFVIAVVFESGEQRQAALERSHNHSNQYILSASEPQFLQVCIRPQAPKSQPLEGPLYRRRIH